MYRGEYDHELFSTYVSPEEQKRLDAELAQTQEIEKEVQRLRKQMNSVPWRLFRIVVRLGRILIGGTMLAGVCVLVVGGSPLASLSRLPLAAMSIGSLLAMFVWFGIFAGLAVLSCTIAFGEPPGDDALWRDARLNVLERQAQKTRVAAAYRKSKFWGLLNDPDLFDR